jgi:hypothetical protein
VTCPWPPSFVWWWWDDSWMGKGRGGMEGTHLMTTTMIVVVICCCGCSSFVAIDLCSMVAMLLTRHGLCIWYKEKWGREVYTHLNNCRRDDVARPLMCQVVQLLSTVSCWLVHQLLLLMLKQKRGRGHVAHLDE